MRPEKGFSLIELMIVVAIIGIIAAIAIPNLLVAVERSRQKKSVHEVRTMVIAMQSFSTDFGGYPNTAQNGDVSVTFPAMMDATGPVIVPSLIQAVPNYDGWLFPYIYFAGPDGTRVHPELGATTALHFIIYSTGSDGAPGGGTDGSSDALSIGAAWCSNPQGAIPGVRDTHCFESDIVWGDSSFQQSPDAKQRLC